MGLRFARCELRYYLIWLVSNTVDTGDQLELQRGKGVLLPLYETYKTLKNNSCTSTATTTTTTNTTTTITTTTTTIKIKTIVLIEWGFFDWTLTETSMVYMYFDLHGVRKFIYNMKTYIKIFIRISTVDNQMIFLVQFEKKKTPESFLKDYIVYSPFINKLV